MDKVWCLNKQSAYDTERNSREKEIRDLCTKLTFLPNKTYEVITTADIGSLGMFIRFLDIYAETTEQKESLKIISEKLNSFVKDIGYCHTNYMNLCDSEPKEYDGDIIITDPCYFIRDENWDKFCSGEMDEILQSLPNMMFRDNLWGDWSCGVFSNNKKIGEFCADSGMVCVVCIDEVMKFNPNFDYFETKPWTTTIIKNFKGTIKFQILLYNEDGEEDYELQVVGEGINKITGEPLNFFSTMTGF